MSDNYNNILQPNEHNEIISDELLLKYTKGEATPEEQYLVELHISNHEMEADAIEGITVYADKNNDIHKDVGALKENLQKMVAKNKERRLKRKWKDSTQSYVVAFILLLTAVAAFYLIKVVLTK
jgi:hypothetical protein